MSSVVVPIVCALLLVLALAAGGTLYRQFKRTFYFGIVLWSRWLPVLATGVYLAVLASNLAGREQTIPAALDLSALFSVPEMIVLFLIGPLFLTKAGNVLAAATVVYAIERFLLGGALAAQGLSVHLLIGPATIVAVLGDKMPWLSEDSYPFAARKLRELLLAVLTLGAMAVMFTGIIKVHGFSQWLRDVLVMDVAPSLILGGLVALFIGWLSVALGFTRHFMIAILSLPTLFVLAYVTGWPGHFLVIPFAMSLSLALATADRRRGPRRGHRTSYHTAYGWGRL